MRRLALVLFAGIVSSLPLTAQEILWRVEGVSGSISRGFELQRLGDVNGDGWEDMIEQGFVADLTNPWGYACAFFVASSQNGAILSSSGPIGGWTDVPVPQSLAPAGDMNQDGVPDYAVTIYDAGNPNATMHVEVRSGLTHAILWTTPVYGSSLAGEVDLDGDGRLDLIVAVRGWSPLGTIVTYDNAGNELYRIVDPLPNVLVGVDVAPLHADLNGDGFEDFLSAGPDWLNRGAVVVFSGKDGSIVQVSYGVQAGDKLSNACGCGDLDGDGVADYAGGGEWGASVVTAFSGATGLPIHTWRTFGTQSSLGINVMSGFDVDQDGVNDLISGQNQEGVSVMAGRDGTFLAQYWTPVHRGAGWGQVLLAPPPGERYPLFVWSEREWNSPLNPCGSSTCPGLLWAYRGNPVGVRAFGPADASPGFALPRSGMRDLPSNPVRFTLSNAPPGALALLAFGTSQTSFGPLALPAPLDPFGLPGITLLTSLDVRLLALTGTTGTNRGYASFDLNANLVATGGVQLYSQWLWFDPTDLAQSGSTPGQRFRMQ